MFAGWPLLVWSIAAAKKSKYVTRTIVSTDDAEIAEIARKFGTEVPFIRPAKYAQDNSLDLPVFQHALKWLMKNENYKPDIVIHLRPTSPIRPKNLVDDSIRLLKRHLKADSVRGVVASGQNPFKMWRLKGVNSPMKNLIDVPRLHEPYNSPRQILPQTYWQTGQIDAIRTSAILEENSMSGKNIYPIIIDSKYSVDIDNLQDWERYEDLVSSGELDLVSPDPRK